MVQTGATMHFVERTSRPLGNILGPEHHRTQYS